MKWSSDLCPCREVGFEAQTALNHGGPWVCGVSDLDIDRAFSREFGEFPSASLSLALCGLALKATLAVPSLEVAMGI